MHIGDTKNRNKTCELYNMCPSNKRDWADEVSVSAIMLVQGCVGVD